MSSTWSHLVVRQILSLMHPYITLKTGSKVEMVLSKTRLLICLVHNTRTSRLCQNPLWKLSAQRASLLRHWPLPAWGKFSNIFKLLRSVCSTFIRKWKASADRKHSIPKLMTLKFFLFYRPMKNPERTFVPSEFSCENIMLPKSAFECYQENEAPTNLQFRANFQR